MRKRIRIPFKFEIKTLPRRHLCSPKEDKGSENEIEKKVIHERWWCVTTFSLPHTIIFIIPSRHSLTHRSKGRSFIREMLVFKMTHEHTTYRRITHSNTCITYFWVIWNPTFTFSQLKWRNVQLSLHELCLLEERRKGKFAFFKVLVISIIFLEFLSFSLYCLMNCICLHCRSCFTFSPDPPACFFVYVWVSDRRWEGGWRMKGDLKSLTQLRKKRKWMGRS